MSVFKLSTKDRIVEVEKPKKGFVSVVVETIGKNGTIATAYYLESIHYQKLTSYKVLSALVKYAKANQTTRVYPKTNSNSSLRVETLCPCPPETSFDSTVNANANASANDVDGGILTKPRPTSFQENYVCAKYVDGHCIRWESKKPMVK